MRPQALAALLALLAAPAALAAEGFQRPANGDCIALSTGSDVSLFPEQYMMVGDARAQDGFITQARGAGGAPPPVPSRRRRCHSAHGQHPDPSVAWHAASCAGGAVMTCVTSPAGPIASPPLPAALSAAAACTSEAALVNLWINLCRSTRPAASPWSTSPPTRQAGCLICAVWEVISRACCRITRHLLPPSQRPIPAPSRPPPHPSSLPANPRHATQVVTNSIAIETYVLSQCGAQVPPASQFPEGTKFFTVPLVSLSAPETVPYAFVVR